MDKWLICVDDHQIKRLFKDAIFQRLILTGRHWETKLIIITSEEQPPPKIRAFLDCCFFPSKICDVYLRRYYAIMRNATLPTYEKIKKLAEVMWNTETVLVFDCIESRIQWD